MRPVSAEITIDAPRERVYALLADLSLRLSFTDHFIDSYHLLRIDAIGVGAGARYQLPAAKAYFDTVIDEAEPPHRIVERGRGGRLNRVPVVTEWCLAETAGRSGCELSVTFWTEPSHPFDRLQDLRSSERKVQRGWRRALERVREIAEQTAPPERLALAGADRI